MSTVTDLDVAVPLVENDRASSDFEDKWHELKLCLEEIKERLDALEDLNAI